MATGRLKSAIGRPATSIGEQAANVAELLFNGVFKTRKEAKINIFEYIEAYYNKRRIHSALG